MTPATSGNPLLEPWHTPYGLPPFERIRAEHYEPAFSAAMAEQLHELAAIANDPAAPDFQNTLAAYDRSGRALRRIDLLFHNIAGSASSPEIQAVERNMAPRLAAHRNAIYLDAKLFARIEHVHDARNDAAMSPEARQLTERIYLDFIRAGALLSSSGKARAAAIAEALATLTTRFRQNVLADESSYVLLLENEDDLAGLPLLVREAAREAARARGYEHGWAITLSRSLIVPFLTFSDVRPLRERAFRAWTSRGEHEGPYDNRMLVREILALRAELAQLHGHASYAEYALADRMARHPRAVSELLTKVWEPAKRNAEAELAEITTIAKANGHAGAIEPWDWRYYAEKVRKARFDLDDTTLKPYFPLSRMIEAAFDCAHRLFGVRFVARDDLHAYHPDVRVYEVRDRDDRVQAIFLADNYARPDKRSGAWMSALRYQSARDGGTIPIILNNNNFAKAPAGTETLLSADDVRTLFHEFGHGLHGMLSQVTYERLSGTNVLRDFVELPSQLFEHWATEREVLKKHARHYRSGDAIPDLLIKRMEAAQHFNQGFETVEYVACALLDMELHAQSDVSALDITQFEEEQLARIGMPREILLRHRLPHFLHLFAGDSYAAGYYVYMWAEVLDADAFEAFLEAGDPFHGDTAGRLLEHVYAAGGTRDPSAAFRAFRGRDAEVNALLRKRGLVGSAARSP